MTTTNEYLNRLQQELERIIDDPTVDLPNKQYLLATFHTLSKQIANDFSDDIKPAKIKEILAIMVNKTKHYIDTHQLK